MKKYITLAALLVAGSAFANATEATWTYSTKSGLKDDGATYSGVSFTLGSPDADRVTSTVDPLGAQLPKELNLESIALTERTSQDFNSNYKYVLYVVDNNRNLLAMSDLGTKSGDVWTFSFDSSSGVLETAATNKKSEINATTNKLALSTSDIFCAYIIASSHVEGANSTWTFGIGETVATGQYSSSPLAAMGGSLNNTTANQWGLLSKNGLATLGYAPNMTIVASSIPEPSTFGLLAGLGALALVGTRRRRK